MSCPGAVLDATGLYHVSKRTYIGELHKGNYINSCTYVWNVQRAQFYFPHLIVRIDAKCVSRKTVKQPHAELDWPIIEHIVTGKFQSYLIHETCSQGHSCFNYLLYKMHN